MRKYFMQFLTTSLPLLTTKDSASSMPILLQWDMWSSRTAQKSLAKQFKSSTLETSIHTIKSKKKQCKALANICNMQSVQILNKVWRIFQTFLKGRYMNFAVFSLFGDKCFINLLQLVIQSQYQLINEIVLYPDLIEDFVENIYHITEYLMEIVFNNYGQK